ncbi:PQQ-like domain-containing protein [Prauserella marina]|uniref:PQQ-like domain-containing protein n=1 Tax=Prauserella marina TaxID=530584 RepID=A0A1G6X598_9PSEU|nr:putative pyrroloquinoline-quinone binding quinoprotein [Prauserella marina]SDD72547.1 PQQ-like domain-containing protein [Prauserella marina]
MITGCSGPAGLDVEVDHVVGEAPPPLGAEGPEAEGFTESWRAPVKLPEGDARFALSAGNVVAGGADGVFAFAATTGEPTWRYAEPGRTLSAWVATDDTVVIESHGTDADDNPADWHVIALDSGTGERLWERTDNEWRLDSGEPVAGTVLGRIGGYEAQGIDARTGETRWSFAAKDVPGGCTAPTGGSDQATGSFLLQLGCGGKDPDRVFGTVDAETGKAQWFRAIREGDRFPLPERRRDLSTYRMGSGAPLLIDWAGNEVRTEDEHARCPCVTLDQGDRTLLAYRVPDLAGRTSGWVSELGEDGVAKPVAELRSSLHSTSIYSAAEGRLYGIGPARPGFPSTTPLLVAMVDGEEVSYAALPVALAENTREDLWFEVAGERVFLAMRREGDTEFVISSYTPAKKAGGAAFDEWTDPCTLLSGVVKEERALPPDDPEYVGEVSVPLTRCSGYLRVGEREPVRSVDLSVVWVAPSAAEAEALLATSGATSESAVGADQEHRDETGTTLLRVGAVIVSVDTFDFEEDQRDKALRGIVTNLRAR